MTSIDLAPHNPYGLSLRSPVLAAAGCFGYGLEYARMVDLAQVGAIVTRSTSLTPRRVARRPRVQETPAGLLSIGPWPNPGLRIVIERYAPLWAGWVTPVILSLAAPEAAEYAQLAAALEGVEGLAGLELLIEDPATAAAITRAVRAVTQLPLLVKLPPLDPGLPVLAAAVAAAGADALTLISGPRGLYTDPHSGELLEGELCGPAIQPLALRLVAEVLPNVDLPVIACGGIANVEDARRFLALGATAVQIGAALLADPFALPRIAQQLADT